MVGEGESMAKREGRPARQPRRGGDEVRRLVLGAAEQLFEEKGYHETKTREIAEIAGVGEPVIFRNFGSKAELFESTILESFNGFVAEWVRSWGATTPESASNDEITRSFVEGFLDLAAAHRELLLTLIAARVKGGDPQLAQVADNVLHAFAGHLAAIHEVLLDQGELRDFNKLDHPVTLAAATGAVMSVVLLDDWLFPLGGTHPSRERIVEELRALLLHGILHR